jgi:hypothetical protein
MKAPIKYRNNVRTRSDLFALLTEACELEHGLACSYLYSAFSLKQGVGEGLSGKQLQYVKKWAAQIFYIASQEMLHLSQVWNLLNAIGGTPYYFRPNFPQPSKYYPFNVPLELEPFSLEALRRFIMYELPGNIDEKAYAKKSFGFVSEDDYTYKTVGELYSIISEGFRCIDESELFIGSADLQLGQDDTDFYGLIKVTDRNSAIQAIDTITEQGEGTKEDREDSHYGIFKAIEHDYKEILEEDITFQPSRYVITNPVTFLKGNYSSGLGEVIINSFTRDVSDLFDDVYNLMLRCLQFSFSYSIDRTFRRHVLKFAINLMVRVIKPLGETLTLLPAYNDLYFKKAGASFSLTRHIPYPQNAKLAFFLMEERSNELKDRLVELAKEHHLLEGVSKSYNDVLNSFNATAYLTKVVAKA